MKKYLITGGCGFIGSNFINDLFFKENCVIYNLDCLNYAGNENNINVEIRNNKNYIFYNKNLLESNFLEKLFSENYFDYIIHFAAQTHVDSSYENTNDYIMDNILATQNLLHFFTKMINYKNSQFIHISTDEVYGSSNNIYKKEDELLNPSNPYSATKASAEMFVISYAHSFNINYKIIRMNNVYGENQHLEKVIPKFINQIYNKENITIHGDGNYKRCFLYITDACDAINLIKHQTQNDIYNISSNDEISILDLAKLLIKKLSAESSEIKFIKDRPYNDRNYLIDSNKIKQLGFKQQISFNEGINRVITDFYLKKGIIKLCLVCNNNVEEIFNLGYQPLANDFQFKLDINTNIYPLILNKCINCHHLQLNNYISNEKLFCNYLYKSGTTKTMNCFFENFAKNIENKHQNSSKNFKVLDIACNDGTQLSYFSKKNIRVGVDPAKNLYNESKEKATEIIVDFFNSNVVKHLKTKYHIFDYIIAQNVFAHIIYPNDFLKYCSELMNENSTLYIQTSQSDMIKNNEFGTIYHEHISFFNINSMNELCKKNNLYIHNINYPDVHGKSYLFELKLKTQEKKIDFEFNQEKENYLKNKITYTNYVKNCIYKNNEFENIMISYKKSNYSIIGYGAPAKAMTELNFSKINSLYIDFIIDDNELKQNRFTPGKNIPIKSFNYFLENYKKLHSKILIVIFSWNYYNEIIEKLKTQIPIESHPSILFLNTYSMKIEKC